MPVLMRAKHIIKLCILFILILIVLLIIHVKNDNSSELVTIIKQTKPTKRKYWKGPNNINSWPKEGNEGENEKLEDVSDAWCSLSAGCPLAFAALNGSEEMWFQNTFKNLSPYTQQQKIKNYIIQSTRNEDNTTENNQIGPNSKDTNNQNHRAQNPLHTYKDSIVIITPISDAKNKLHNYFRLLCSLTYPHHLISVLLGEDSSEDGTLYEARAYVEKLHGCFNKIEVVHLIGKQLTPSGNLRHHHDHQFFRRSHLAMARNQLLIRGVAENKWVLWIDVDVKFAPRDLIQHLLSSHKDIATVNCLYRTGNGGTDVYDRNSWLETESSRIMLAQKSPNYLMLEGYGPTERKYLNDLKYEEEEYEEYVDDGYTDNNEDEDGGEVRDRIGNFETRNTSKNGDEKSVRFLESSLNSSFHKVESLEIPKQSILDLKRKKNIRNIRKKKKINLMVKLDGVGGCVLLVKADLHRKGLNFPAFVYKHHIETEAFAKMAISVYNKQPYGLPHVYAIHW